MILTLSSILVLLALVLALFELFVRANTRSPIVWAVVFLALALLVSGVRTMVVAG